MYCVIQEIKTKKEIKGHSKGIEAYSYTINNVKINSYRMKAEKFKRPIIAFVDTPGAYKEGL